MAADGAARLPHPRPGRAAAVSPRLLILQGKSRLILQLVSVSKGHCTNCHRWTRVVAVTALPYLYPAAIINGCSLLLLITV